MQPADDSNDPFRFEYDPGVIRYGDGVIADLEDELAKHEFRSALVVSGTTVGTTPEVIEPVKRGLGDRLGGVFARTTPKKLLDTAYDGLDAMRETDSDVLVSLGGGSSLDAAKVISVLSAVDQPREAVGERFESEGTIPVPDASLTPIVAVPTTLAGADLSTGAGVNAGPSVSGLVDEPVSGGVSDPRLMPTAVFYDPELFATTPRELLAASAMNGFDKGIETLYAKTATPITDSTATRGLELLQSSLPELGPNEGTKRDDPNRTSESSDEASEMNEESDGSALGRAVRGIILVQYGIARPGTTTLGLIHAFGHALTTHSEIQQGAAHAIMAPHALEYQFAHADCRRSRIADALGVGSDDSQSQMGEAVVTAVTNLRDALGLPSRLRSVDDLDRANIPTLAATTFDDSLVGNTPDGVDPTVEELEQILREAW